MRTAPPRGSLSLSNPLARGLSSAVTFDEQTGGDLYDRVTKQIWRHQGGGSSQWDGSAGGNGYGFLTVAANNWFTYQGNPETFLASTNVSVVVAQKKLDTTNRGSAPFGTFSGPGSRCSAHMPFSDGNVYWDFGGTGGANRLSVSTAGLDLRQDNIWVFTAGSHGSEIWFNGHRLASQTTAITRAVDVATYTINAAQGVNGDVAVYSAFYVYQRVLQESEIKRLAVDPYAPFRPRALLIAQQVEATTLAGRAATATRANADLDAQIHLTGRSATSSRSAAALTTSTALTGRSQTSTRSQAALTSTGGLACVSRTTTRSSAALDAQIAITGPSETGTRSHTDLTTIIRLTCRTHTTTRSNAILNIQFGDLLVCRSRSASRSRCSLKHGIGDFAPVTVEGSFERQLVSGKFERDIVEGRFP